MTLAAWVASLGPPAGHAESGGMKATWWFAESEVTVWLDGPTEGWLAVGFNDRPELAGSRLVLAAVAGGAARAEEHVAQPPNHPFVRALAVRAAEERAGRTQVVVALPRQSLAPGSACGLTLAWSHEDDFGHHSAHRELLSVRL